MLPRASRLNSSADFRRAIRHGVRAGRSTLVLHAGTTSGQPTARVGLVVSKAVGNAVVRNRVKRRLRHLALQQLEVTPPEVDVVIRALPRSADQAGELSTDLAGAWSTALRRLDRTT